MEQETTKRRIKNLTRLAWLVLVVTAGVVCVLVAVAMNEPPRRAKNTNLDCQIIGNHIRGKNGATCVGE